MVACGVQRLFSIDKGLPPNRGGAAAGLWQEANTPSEVLPRDPGVARDHDLCTALTALIMSIIPPIVAVVRSTYIHPITAPDGYEATRGRCGSGAEAGRILFEKRTWKLAVSLNRVITTYDQRKFRRFSSTVSPWRPSAVLGALSAVEIGRLWGRFVRAAQLATAVNGGARPNFLCMTGSGKRALAPQLGLIVANSTRNRPDPIPL